MTLEAREDSEEQFKQDLLVSARELVKCIEEGDENSLSSRLEELVKYRDTELYSELGKLTRELHDSLNNFQLDSKVASMAEQDIPDAKARLQHVIQMTEDAANKTMNAVEAVMPVSEKLQQLSKKINKKWKRFRSSELSVEEFREMSRDLDDFLAFTEENSKSIHSHFTEIMLAQDFQDLTGQIIKRVIELVQEVEDSLVRLIKLGGRPVSDISKPTKITDSDERGHGPQVPEIDNGDRVGSQDDVDDLLSSLGF